MVGPRRSVSDGGAQRDGCEGREEITGPGGKQK